MSENPNGVTVTFKGGAGFESPWIVIHAQDPQTALDQINDVSFAELSRRTTDAAEFFRGLHTAKQAFPAAKSQPVQQAAPAPQQGGWNAPAQAPAPSWSQQGSQQSQAPGPSCAHGAREFVDGRKKGKNWVGWFCPTPQGTPGQCKPEFLDKKDWPQ